MAARRNRSPRQRAESASLADAASEQIRAVLEAAERAAAEIRAQAEQEAERIRRQALEEATGIRSQARGELGALIESIRLGLTRVRADLDVLEEKLTAGGAGAGEPEPAPAAGVKVSPELDGVEASPKLEVGAPARPRTPGEQAPVAGAPPAPAPRAAGEGPRERAGGGAGRLAGEDAGPGEDAEAGEDMRAGEDVVAGEDTRAGQDTGAGEDAGAGERTGATEEDLESARLVALNMALEGAEREVVDRYLRENFSVADRAALLDEVYALVQG